MTAPVRPFAKRAYHAIRLLPDNLLHASRHRRAMQLLRGMRRPRQILVICHGNICRSPYLEAVLRRDLKNVEVSSAGFLQPRRPVPANSLIASARRGLDLSAFRSRTITKEMVAAADLVITMDARQAQLVVANTDGSRPPVMVAGDLDPVRCDTRSVVDPWNQDIEVFESSFDRLDRCAATIVRALLGR